MIYQSHADLGGQNGHGAVQPEPEGDLWHEAFEPKALALTLAMGATGEWNIDQSRAARETLPAYAGLSYYRIWLTALHRLLAERGLVADDELAAGHALYPTRPLARVLSAASVPAALAKGSTTARPAATAARFQAGDRVRTRSAIAGRHTRLPGYAQACRGRVERVHGTHVFADTHAHGQGEQPQWLYTVVFDATELWGVEAQAGLEVSVDAWEPYLDADIGDAT